MWTLFGIASFIYFVIYTLIVIIEEKLDSIQNLFPSERSRYENALAIVGTPISLQTNLLVIISKALLYGFLIFIGFKISWIFSIAFFIIRSFIGPIISLWIGYVAVLCVSLFIRNDEMKIMYLNKKTMSTAIVSLSRFIIPCLMLAMWAMILASSSRH